jgi:hypothetical protein
MIVLPVVFHKADDTAAVHINIQYDAVLLFRVITAKFGGNQINYDIQAWANWGNV